LPTLIWLYIGIGVVFILSDIVVPSGGILSAIGSTFLIVGVLEYSGVSGLLQVILFIPIAAILSILFFKIIGTGGAMLERFLLPDKISTNTDAMVGKEGTVYSVEDDTGLIRAEIFGDYWVCRGEKHTQFCVGDHVVVKDISDTTLIIERL